MKILKLITAILAVAFSFTSCEDKEFEIEKSFPFEAIVSGETKALLSNPLETKIRLIQTREIQGVEYFVSYSTSKDGIYELRGVDIPTDTEIEISSLEETIIYKPKEAGKHLITFNLRDSNGNTDSANLEYEITEGDIINFSATAQNSIIDPNESAIINLNIEVEENEIVPQDLVFTLIFENTTSSDPITISGQTLNSGDRLSDIDASNFIAEYFPSNSGQTDILKFTLEASNGKTLNQEVSITTNETDFDFSFVPSVNESIVGREVSVAFEITQTTNEALTYDIRISGKQGLLYDENIGTQFLPTEVLNISSGSRAMRFNATAVDINDLIIEVSASNGLTKSQTVSFESLPVDFDFDFNPSTITVINRRLQVDLQESVSIILNRPNDLEFIDPEYSMTILSDVGTFEINSINGNHSPGSNINLPEGSTISNDRINGVFEFPRTLTNSGQITVIVRNDTGFEVRKTIDVEVLTD